MDKNSIILANQIWPTLGVSTSRDLPQVHGQICLANDSLIEQSTYRQEITTWGVGYSDPNRNLLASLRDFLAPRRTSARNATVTTYDKDEPFEVVDYKKVKRNPGADFLEVRQRTATKSTITVPNRGLCIRLDKDQLKEKPNWQVMHTQWLIDLMLRASILEIFAIYNALAVTNTLNWDGGASPDLDIRTEIVEVIAAAIGFHPNRAVYGELATLLRQKSYESQDNAGAFARANLMTDAQIATAIGVQSMRTNVERYHSGNSVKSNFLGSKVLLFTAVDGESPEDPSNVVRHVASATYGGGEYAVYIHEVGVKTVYITVENYELINAQHADGVELITVQ
jgi:hypothetical protein